MKALFLLPLFISLFNFNNQLAGKAANLPNSQIQGRWTQKRIQIQYVVDSHLVHEKEVTTEKGKVYIFNGSQIRVEYPGGTSAEGTYSVFTEDNSQKIVLQLPGATTTYNLIALTPSGMVWQTDLDDTYYTEGSKRKSAERAIYTEEFTKQ